MSLYLCKKFIIRAEAAEGEDELIAFDNVLLKCGIGDVSLVKTTSILPPNAELVQNHELPPGANVPAIYTAIISNKRGEKIAAAIAVAWTDGGPTLVAEYSATGITKEDAERKAIERVKIMARNRNLKITRIETRTVDHIVEKCACAIAVVVEIPEMKS